MKATAMDTKIPVEDLLAGEKIPVGVGEIDKELVTLWQATAQCPGRRGAGRGHAGARAEPAHLRGGRGAGRRR